MFNIPMNIKPIKSLLDMATSQMGGQQGTNQNYGSSSLFGQQGFNTSGQQGFNTSGQQGFNQQNGYANPELFGQQGFNQQNGYANPELFGQQGFNQQNNLNQQVYENSFGGQQSMQQPYTQPNYNQSPNYNAPAQQPIYNQPQEYNQQVNQQPIQNNYNQQSIQRPAATGVMLKKGQKTSLTQLCPNLDLIEVGLGWDLTANGMAYDLDVEAFMLGQNGKVLGDDWFVFYGQLDSPDNSVSLLKSSDNGVGTGDDEIMQIRLSRVNPGVSKILFVVTINEAKENGYNFSNIQNAYVRIVDKSSGKELIRFNLTDYYNTVCSMMVGEVYRHNNEWKFSPIGDGVAEGLEGLCIRYGVNVG